MKKLLTFTFVFSCTFALAAGLAFGQANDVTLDQAGDGDVAFVDQVGTNNTATVTQSN